MAIFDIPPLYTRKGTLRAYHLAGIVFISAFLAGYDSGVAGGILTFKPFEADFHYTAKSKSRVNSMTVGLEQLGSFVAAACTYPIVDRFGRKWTIIGSAAVFILGVIIQTVNTGNLGGWYTARVIAGLGMGAQSVAVPMYSAEMTPREIRGRCGSFYQWLYAWGVFLAYWVNYGVAQNSTIAKKSEEWQIPVGLQMVSGGMLLLGTLTLPESVRWLLQKDRTEEAWKALTWIRGDDGQQTAAEFKSTQLGLQAERADKANFSFRELLEPANRLRFLIGPSLFIFQNATGSSALAVFAPQYFQLLVGSDGNRDLLLTGLFGAVKVIASTFFIWVLSERFGRRNLMTGGASAMAACMLITALIPRFRPAVDKATGAVTSAGRATVAMIYLDIMIYNCSWGPLPWAYVPEIFPTRIRALGQATSMLAHWATSFCFSFASPYMVANIGLNTFLIFMSFDLLATVFCLIFVRETRGKNLEVAAGTEWEIAEKSAADPEHDEGGARSAESQDPHGPPGEKAGFMHAADRDGRVLVNEATGAKIELMAVKDTFSTNLKRR